MKKVATLMTLALLFTVLLANDLQVPARTPINQNLSHRVVEQNNREVYEVDFLVAPQQIALSYYDYMPGSYNDTPLHFQPETAGPYGYPAGGLYLPFMTQETASSLRRIYYSYIDASGNISTAAAISPNAIREGYPGSCVDYVTGNPFVAWHNVIEADESYDCSMSYDMFNVVGGPGLWKQPFLCIDNPEDSEPYTLHDNDEFIWPQVWIGPSPITDMRRVYVYGNNYTSNLAGYSNYNSLLGYTDVQYDEVNFDMSLTEWTYQSFSEFDDWHYNDVGRAIKDMVVSDDGQVAFIGHRDDQYFLYHSADYGESWDFYQVPAHWDVFNPQNTDGSYVFENTDGSPGELYIEPNSDGGHFNVVFTEDNTKIVYMTAFGLNTVETASNNQYYPAHFHPKIVYFDTVTEEFKFVDLQITGVDPYDDQPMIPYDLNEDGIVDGWDENGNVEFVTCLPSHFFNGDYQDACFHESLFKLVTNNEMGWVAAFFMDGRYLEEAYWETPGFEDWAETPQFAISVSSDHGVHWSEPAYMNAKTDDENYHPELDGMQPCYCYPADQIIVEDDTHGSIPIIFFDDNSYGSWIQNEGQNNGGNLMYAELLVEFPPVGTNNNEITPILTLNQNYPNPFNPTTTIEFATKESGNVTIDIFNVKGQKVKTLVNEFKAAGNYYVTWNGTDQNSKPVDSGIYFYKMSAKDQSTTKKMVLLK